jgi:hypothetical protein
MTKKHFIALAAEIAKIGDYAARALAANAVATVAVRDNPRFDRARFLKAAGVATE